MKVLIVGAGAVGQVFGRHLVFGGARVTFLVKEKYAPRCRSGLPLYALNHRKQRKTPQVFTDFDVITSTEEVARGEWDQVWLCVSSTALRGTWLDPFIEAIGSAVTVSLQPGLEEREYLLERIDSSRLAFGLIGFVSYQTPLPCETLETSGIAYWFPPLAPSLFSGPTHIVDPIVATLRRGKCPARISVDASRASAKPTAILMPHLAVLEASGWSFDRLAAGGGLKTAAGASREALAVVSSHYDENTTKLRFFVRAFLFRLLLWIAPRFTPFNLEAYLQYHFTKVGDQTRYLLASYVRLGVVARLPVQDLRQLEVDLERAMIDSL